MNKNKVAIGVIVAAIITTLAYNQTQQPEQPEQSSNTESVRDVNKGTLASSSSDRTVTSPPDAAERNETQIDEVKTASVSSSVTSQNNRKHLASAHEQPADHSGSSQPKHHGHEHSQQRRHPEDNSIIPPGEPKKPLPEQEDKS